MKQYIPTSTVPTFGLPGQRSYRFRQTQKTQTYDVLHRAGSVGLTAPEISKQANVPLDRVRFYLSELRRAGYIAVKGDPTTVSATMGAKDAAFAAMLGLENALVAKVREDAARGVSATPEMDRAFVKYSKFKERSLSQAAPGSSAAQVQAQEVEAKMALRMALLELVKLVY